jgi:ketosteroid isomerase-like protein
MTPEALAVVRAFLEAYAARDFDGIATCVDPDVVVYGTRGGLDEKQVLRGPDAWIEYMREILEPWQRFDFEAERLIDVGDTILVLLRETAKARHADVEVHSETAVIFKVAHQKIVEARGYLDREEALRAVTATD